MPDKSTTQNESVSKSGVLRRPNFEPETHHEKPRPTTLPEFRDEGSTTGLMPVITEGEDNSAERDDDEGQR